VEITDNVFNENAGYAGPGGGAIQTWGTGSTISSNTFAGNEAHSYVGWAKGGAVLARAGNGNPVSQSVETIIRGNAFDGNLVVDESSSAAQSGGAVCVMGTGFDLTISAQISANEFGGNFAPDFGGAVSLETVLSATVVNNLFVGNEAGAASLVAGGGAIYSDNTTADIVNNTFVMNRVGTGYWPPSFLPTDQQHYPSTFTPAAYGGAVHVRNWGDASLINDIFYGNAALWGMSVASTHYASAQVKYCSAFAGTNPGEHYYQGDYGTVTLLPATLWYCDPVFLGGTLHPYWLQSTSPVIGVGLSHASDSRVPTTDKDGQPRPANESPDLGAYEYTP
jgi:hypothetical protein